MKAQENIILQELRAVDRSPKALRNFGLIMATVALLLAAMSAWKHHTITPWSIGWLGVAVLFSGMALLSPQILRRPHTAWMFVSLCLGWVMSRVILVLLFIGVVIPTHLVGRICGLSFMRMRGGAGESSLWVQRKPRERKHHEKLY